MHEHEDNYINGTKKFGQYPICDFCIYAISPPPSNLGGWIYCTLLHKEFPLGWPACKNYKSILDSQGERILKNP